MKNELSAFLLAIVLMLPLVFALLRRCRTLTWQLRIRQCDADAAKVSERHADELQTRYSRAKLKQEHLEAERHRLQQEVTRLNGLLMAKQGASEN